MVAMRAPSTSGRLASIPARGRSRHEAQVHLARRAIYAVGEQAGITGIELPVAPELAPWGYAERRLAFARPDLGHRRFHVVAGTCKRPGSLPSLSRGAAYQPAILTRSRLVQKTSYTWICSVDRNETWTTSGSRGFLAVSARPSPQNKIQHGRPAQVYGAQERVGAISTWSKLSGQSSILGISYTHSQVYSIRDGRMAVSPSHRSPSSLSGASSKRRMPRCTC